MSAAVGRTRSPAGTGADTVAVMLMRVGVSRVVAWCGALPWRFGVVTPARGAP
ncbi:hypothetical protein GCM10027047_22010 [Rhodococcus aerolatus]